MSDKKITFSIMSAMIIIAIVISTNNEVGNYLNRLPGDLNNFWDDFISFFGYEQR